MLSNVQLNALGFGSMFISSYLATCLAGSEEHADLGSHLLPLIFFPLGTTAIVAELQDTGRPYKHHLVYGYGVGVSLSIFFALNLGALTFLPIAIGMSAQTVMMTIRLFEFSSLTNQPDYEFQLQAAAESVFTRNGSCSWIRGCLQRMSLSHEYREQLNAGTPRTPLHDPEQSFP